MVLVIVQSMSGVFSRSISAILAAFAGASVWISLGILAVTQSDSRTRIVALPPLWFLGLLVAVPAVIVWRRRVGVRRLRPLAMTALLWLPYLPGQIPSAFLLWQGPIEGLVWLTVAAGFVAEAAWSVPSFLPRLTQDPVLAPWVAGGVSALLLIVGSAALADRLPNGDEPHYLMIAQSLLHDRDLQIQNNHDLIQYQSFWPNKLEPHYVARGLNGQIYSVHSPGVAAMVLPAFGLFGYVGAQATVIAAAAVTAGLVWSTAWLLTASAMAAWLAWAALSLSTPFFLHALTIFPDGPGALCVAVALAFIVQLEYRGTASAASAWVTGTALAVLPWLHTRFAVLAVALGLVVALRLIGRQAILAAHVFAVPCISALAWFGYFWTIWGTINPAAPYGALTDLAWRHTGPGALGLLLDQRYGLLATAPGFLCGIAGLAHLARRRPRLAAEFLVVAIPYVVAASSYGMWWGGFGGPARFLVAMVPIAAVPVACLWAFGGPVARALTALPLLTGAAVLAARVFAEAGSMAYAETFGPDPVAAWAAPSVNLPEALLSLGANSVWRDTVVWCATASATIGGAIWIGHRLRLAAGAAWQLVTGSAALALMLGATASWRGHDDRGISPLESQLAFISGWNPGTLPTVLQWRRPYRASPSQLMRRLEVPMAVHAMTERPRASDLTAGPHFGAADYSIALEGALPLHGEVVVKVGDTTLPLERWRLDDMTARPLALPLRLPVPVAGLRLYADDAAMASIKKGSLHLMAVRPSATGASTWAHRAARFGSVRVFFLDDMAYPEPSGFWTRGGAETTVMLDHGATERFTEVTVTVQSGPIATTVDLSIEGNQRRVTLGPSERREVVLQVADGDAARRLSVQTGAMFRPVQHDARSGDFRPLGVWIELR